MKRIATIALIIIATAMSGRAQSTLREALESYDYGKAIHMIDSLMAQENADSVGLALQKARCLRKLYRVEKAAETLAEVLHLDQFNVELMAELAECHRQAGNSGDAFQMYSILSGMQPDNVYFKLCKARILFSEKQYGESVGICKEIIARDSIPEVLSMIGDCYYNLKQSDSALVYYDHVLRQKPRHAGTVSKKANILLADKQYKSVTEMAREFLYEEPDNMTVLPIYGLALHLQGSYPLSIETFEHQRELGDDSYAVHYYIGLNHYMMSNWPRAIPELEKAYQIDSSDVTLVYQLAHAKSHRLSRTGMESSKLNPESERLYAKAIGMMQPDPKMMHNIYGSMAMARHTAEMFEDAIKYYELSYKYNPKNISALSSIGYCYERMKKYDKALDYYERYLKVGRPGTSGYNFVKESIDYIKQEKFMEEK